MKRSVILVSNYIIFLSLLIGTITLGFVSELYDWALGFKNEDLSSVFLIGVFGSVFSFFTYGIFVWPAVLIVNICMETIGLKPKVSVSDCKKLLLMECLLIGFISIYLSSRYQYYYWLFLIPIVAIGQLIRLKIVAKSAYVV